MTPKQWTVTLEDDGVLPLPDDLLDEVGWDVGDEIEWIDNGDGSWSMRRVESMPRTVIEPRPAPANTTMTLTVGQIRALYRATEQLDDDTRIDFVVDRSNGIGPVMRARYQADIDLTDVATW
jgi:bifunctional DNA-binding transcriptional regulator/antitoxin component of YhaV-PrlF toxin-antitoxin module